MTRDDGRTVVVAEPAALSAAGTRRSFLRALGLGGSIVLLPSVFAACDESTSSLVSPEVQRQFDSQQTVTISLNSDVGIFQFALVLEQLEEAFYNQLVGSSAFATLFPAAADQEAINDIRNDEIVHRAFITRALGPAALPQLAFDFGNAFASRASVLAAARDFSNTGVAAYNGGGGFIRNVNNLLVAGKIVSVEGRHAATLLDLDDAGNATGAGEASGQRFANLANLTAYGAVDADARDNALGFTQVAARVDPVVVTPLALTNVPA